MVRFADKLVTNRVVEWTEHYVDYDQLKSLIKRIERKLIQLENANAHPDSLEDTLEAGGGGIAVVADASSLSLGTTGESSDKKLLDKAGPSSRSFYGAVDSAVDRVVNGPDPDDEFYEAIEVEARKVEHWYSTKCAELSDRLDHARDSLRRLKEKLTSSSFYHPKTAADGEEGGPTSIRKHSSSEDQGGNNPISNKISSRESFSRHESVTAIPESPRKRASTNRLFGALPGDHSESDDEVRGDAGTFNRDFHARASLKRSFADIYRQMNYLLGFASLNYTAFVKIVKKHDKVTKRMGKKRALAIIHAYSFCEAEEIKRLMDELERMFAAAFHNRNLTVARNDLLTKNRPNDNLEMLHLGFRFGVVVTLIFWVLWVIAIDALIKPNAAQISASVFIVYRGLSTFILAVWLWGLCLYVWENARVNYIFLFEFDPRDYSTPFSVARKASTMTIMYFTNILLFIKIARGEFLGVHPQTAMFLPLFLFCYVAFMALYTRLGGSGMTALRYVVASPFVEVAFFHSFVADVMTSMVRPFVDMAFSLCFFFSGEWTSADLLHVKDANGSVCMNSWFYQNLVVPFVISLPLWFRFAQCLRRYYDTGKRNPNLLNATKYAIAYSVVLFGALHQPDAAEGFHRMWYAMAVTSSLITFTWDVVMDWGLFKNGVFLRDRLMYPIWSYILAIVLDFGLRFLWTLTLFPSVAEFFNGGAAPGVANADYSPLSMYLTALLGWAEVCRRCMWAFFRVEHEHLTNAFGFRRVDFVPLHFDSPLDHDSTDVKKHMSPINKLGFFFELTVFAGLVIGVAAYTFHWQLSAAPGVVTPPPKMN